MDNNGKVLPAVREAQKRGVIIDAANGGNHWSFKVAEKAIAEGFYPDIISTDLTVKTLFKDPVFSMPYLMSKYLFLKMPLPEIIARCTSIPAKIMGMESEIGQLQEGFLADVAILKRCDKYMPVLQKGATSEHILIPKWSRPNAIYKKIYLMSLSS